MILCWGQQRLLPKRATLDEKKKKVRWFMFQALLTVEYYLWSRVFGSLDIDVMRAAILQLKWFKKLLVTPQNWSGFVAKCGSACNHIPSYIYLTSWSGGTSLCAQLERSVLVMPFIMIIKIDASARLKLKPVPCDDRQVETHCYVAVCLFSHKHLENYNKVYILILYLCGNVIDS